MAVGSGLDLESLTTSPLPLPPLTVRSCAKEEFQFYPVRERHIRAAQGFLIVYSVTSPSSFHEVSQFRDEILRVKDAANVPIVIVGNKARVSCSCVL